jgi:DNA-binding NtrC family response regulator
VGVRKILIVDDNVALAENLAEIIVDADVAETQVAASGPEALVLLERGRFDAMVTDMRMPDMSGTELIRRAHAIDPELPVVVITAFTTDERIAETVREGVLSVLPKPIAMSSLLDLLKRAQRHLPVLIVEDDVALVDTLEEVLRDRGLSSVAVRSLDEIEAVTRSPGVALVDLRLPGASDGAALERLRAHFPTLPLVAMSGLRDPQPPVEPVRFFAKPFDVGEVLRALEEALGARPQAD